MATWKIGRVLSMLWRTISCLSSDLNPRIFNKRAFYHYTTTQDRQTNQDRKLIEDRLKILNDEVDIRNHSKKRKNSKDSFQNNENVSKTQTSLN